VGHDPERVSLLCFLYDSRVSRPIGPNADGQPVADLNRYAYPDIHGTSQLRDL
jgi:hypothetical protein